MKRKADPEEKLTGIVRIGTRLRKFADSPRPERWKVVNTFVHPKYGDRMFVLEMWLKRKRRHVYEVEMERTLRLFYERACKCA